jgi:hypothetical protein
MDPSITRPESRPGSEFAALRQFFSLILLSGSGISGDIDFR